MFEPAAGGAAAGPATAGCTLPPTTWLTVCTVVPLELRPASQLANCWSTDGSTEYTGPLEPLHRRWKTSGSQPPPCDSTPVASCCSRASVVSDLTAAGVPPS